MASLTVRDVMNPHLLYVDEDDSALVARAKILAFGVSGVPVLDRTYRPVGFVSLRDIAEDGKSMRMSTPVVTAQADDSLDIAAQRLSDRNLRHLVVVDARGLAQGMLSAIDVVRALVGVPSRHPKRFDADCTSEAALEGAQELRTSERGA